jgi:hypothetical protein
MSFFRKVFEMATASRSSPIGLALEVSLRTLKQAQDTASKTNASAKQIIQQNSMPRKPIDLDGVAQDLKAMAKTNPKHAYYVYADVLSRIRPAQQGELQRLIGKAIKDPMAAEANLNKGQHVMKGVSMASDTLHGTAAEAFKVSKRAKNIVPLPAKVAMMTVDAKMKYDELRAKGFSEKAAWAGVAAGQATGLSMAGTGAYVGGVAGGTLTSPTGPGAILGAGGGAVVGSAIAGAIDWMTGASDKAALAAANAYDGRNIK